MGCFIQKKQKKMILFDNPILIIFSSYEKPDMNEFSQHKLKIIEVKEDYKCQCNKVYKTGIFTK